jgi:hypothetical protein
VPLPRRSFSLLSHISSPSSRKTKFSLPDDIVTRQVHTEIIFTLAGSKSITDALANFGIADTR